jgi:PPOX class probable F420-dependent enzyme
VSVEAWVADALEHERVARLGTVNEAGEVLLVPICFAVVDGWIVSAVDHKPKRHERLRRLDDIETTGAATVLVDHYDDDWTQLWWVRIRGRAVVDREGDEEGITALRAKYAQYRDVPPAGAVYRIRLDDVRSWRAAR